MRQIVNGYFEKFCEDFGAFDGRLIASRFISPLVVVDSKGNISSYDSFESIVAYFQTYLDKYQSQGVVSCEFNDLDTVQINENALLATVSWKLMNKDKVMVLSWRESYSLVREQGYLKAFSTYDH